MGFLTLTDAKECSEPPLLLRCLFSRLKHTDTNREESPDTDTPAEVEAEGEGVYEAAVVSDWRLSAEHNSELSDRGDRPEPTCLSACLSIKRSVPKRSTGVGCGTANFHADPLRK